jgi:hypothetical protein
MDPAFMLGVAVDLIHGQELHNVQFLERAVDGLAGQLKALHHVGGGGVRVADDVGEDTRCKGGIVSAAQRSITFIACSRLMPRPKPPRPSRTSCLASRVDISRIDKTEVARRFSARHPRGPFQSGRRITPKSAEITG